MDKAITSLFLTIGATLLALTVVAQSPQERWQQHVTYMMEVEFDVETHRFNGTQELVYTNNSPDTLGRVFFHLYFNAFQPGSMMDVRSRNISDPSSKIRDRISKLGPAEIGSLTPTSFRHNNKDIAFTIDGTIMEAALAEPILPGAKATFEMDFNGQVPIQIRRSGRNSAEGISYSMSQWYPKLCEYDVEGWHANPYIGREFYGVWGDFDVKISLDADYVVAASGYCQNPEEVGHGYQDGGDVTHKPGKKLTWHFKAPNVHDFLWAADPDYVHLKTMGPNDTMLHFFYQPDTITNQTWPYLPEITSEALGFMNKQYGPYPYKTYSIIQGGDGGMEYPMATLITGRRSLSSLISVTVHEFLHSWYQMVLGTNESLYAWMDEGFTAYAQEYTKQHLYKTTSNPLQERYDKYFKIVEDGLEEPMSSHADHFNTNAAYGVAAYSKGAVTLGQLEYIMGKSVFDRAFRRYYETWKFKHPTPTDFKRIMEKESGLELDWYFLDWIGTTRTIDYGIKNVTGMDQSTSVVLNRLGEMPMPVEVVVSYDDGTSEMFYMPLRIMRGEKPAPVDMNRNVLPDWPWTYPEYTFTINRPVSEIVKMEIDPTHRMADIERGNNVWELSQVIKPTFD